MSEDSPSKYFRYRERLKEDQLRRSQSSAHGDSYSTPRGPAQLPNHPFDDDSPDAFGTPETVETYEEEEVRIENVDTGSTACSDGMMQTPEGEQPKAFHRRPARRCRVFAAVVLFCILTASAVVAAVLVLKNDETSEQPKESVAETSGGSVFTFKEHTSEAPSMEPSTLTASLLPSTALVPLVEERRPTAFRWYRPATPAPVMSNDVATSPDPFNSTTIDDQDDHVTIFYAIGDTPYSSRDVRAIEEYMPKLSADAEFLIHVGDIRDADESKNCKQEDIELASSLLRLSPVPVFIILGDNEWNDCRNPDEAWQYWQEEFLGYEAKYWNHTFNIVRQPGRPYNFAFEHKGTLFVGLNLVGGPIHRRTDGAEEEWLQRLADQAQWTQQMIREYHNSTDRVGRVVLFGHCDPTHLHDTFFDSLRSFVAYELQNSLPILYLNGDGHEWQIDTDFLGQPSLYRVMLKGGRDLPVKFVVNATGLTTTAEAAFVWDRMLPEEESKAPSMEPTVTASSMPSTIPSFRP